MRRYEVVFVLAPTLSEDEAQKAIEDYSSTAEEFGAKVLDVDLWGQRRLAFPVKKFTEGIYIVLTLEEEAAAAVTELERRFRVTDSVIRFLTVRIDEALKRADKFKTRRDARRAKRADTAREVVAVSDERKAEAEAEPPSEPGGEAGDKE
jgi:small subunit ribosomal protein S6